MMRRTLSLLLALGCLAAASAYKSYRGYQVFSVRINSQENANELLAITQDEGRFDCWKKAQRPGDEMVVMVTPDAVDQFKTNLESRGYEYHVTNEDVGESVERERTRLAKSKQHDYTDYKSLTEIEQWIDQMAENFTQVEIINVGTSYEGRTIRAVKMSTGGTGKPAVWFDSCINAQEWISCASNTYMMQKLMENYGTDPDVTAYLDAIDVYALPVFNVDGYEYTWTGDRFWRKTRSPNPGSSCIGTNPNRNWDYHHCELGSSTDPCSNDYCGTGPFSEIELSTVTSYLSGISNFAAYVAMHAPGNQWMSVYSHHVDPPPDHQDMMAVCGNIVNAIQSVNGEVFECGTVESFYGTTSGSSIDWTRDVLNVTYNYGPQLRGGSSFEVPPEEIIPSGEENYAGMLELLRAVYEDINP